MDPTTWRSTSDLLGKCLDLTADRREELLRKSEEDQPEIVRQVRLLLRTYEEDSGFLERPVFENLKIEHPDCDLTASAADESSGLSNGNDAFSRDDEITSEVKAMSRLPSFWVLLMLNGVVLLVYLFGLSLIWQYGTLTTRFGWDAEQTATTWYITEVDLGSPAAKKLKVGDEITAIDKERVTRTLSLDPALSTVCPGCTYKMSIIREGVAREFSLKREIRQSSWTWVQTCIFFAIGLTFYATAIFIGILKPGERLTQLACLSVLGEAIIFLKIIISPFQAFLQGKLHLLYGAMDLVDGLNMAVAYHFYSFFFRETTKGKLWLALRCILYLWAALVALMRHVDRSGTEVHFWFARAGYSTVQASAPWFYLFASAVICSLITVGYRRTQEEVAARRAKWIVVGAIAGIGPYLMSRLVLSALDTTGHGSLTQTETFLLIRRLAMIPAVLIPFTTAYAILQHRAFDINFVVRRSMQYVLAKSGLRLLLSIPIFGLFYTIIANSHRTIADVILHNVVFIGLIILLSIMLRYHGKLRAWLDRRFFREQYHQDHLLMALSEHLSSFEAPRDMAEYVGKQLMAVLHPRSVVILYKNQNALYSPCYLSNAKATAIAFHKESPLIRLLENGDPARFVSTLRSNLPRKDWHSIARTGADLVVSMTGLGGDVSGLLLLGAKQSEEPYSQYDQHLLVGIAKQMAIVHENNSLQRRLAEQRKAQQDIFTRLNGRQTTLCKECPKCDRCFDHSMQLCDWDGSELLLLAPIDRIVENRYRLDQVIGRGGMGAVYRAMDLRLNREVAVKVVIGSTWDDRTLRRFRREAQAVASLNHPNIVATFDFGTTDTECAFLVMELLRGPTLRSILQAGESVALSLIAEWINQLLNGVESAHAAGIIHRDLKPENVLISKCQYSPDVLKLLDFGIAKRSLLEAKGHSSVLTDAGTLIGTVNYMSPEQLRLEKAVQQSDLFSIAVILIELLTGRNPFASSTYKDRLLHSVTPISWTLGNSKEALALQMIIQKCLADKPESRPSCAREMRSEIIPAILAYARACPSTRSVSGQPFNLSL